MNVKGRSRTAMALVLAVLTVVAAACGGGKSSSPTPQAGTPGAGGTATTAAPKGTVKIGMILAMTGAGSFYGKVMSQGAQLAVDQINAAGGAAGYKLQLVIEDHKSGNADAAVTGARKLISQDHVAAILSSYSAPTLAVQPIAADNSMLVFNGGAVSPALLNKKNLYNTRALGNQLAPQVLTYIFGQATGHKLATIHWNDIAGQSVQQDVKKFWEGKGGQVVDDEPYKSGTTNYSAELARIKAANPDIIGIWSWGTDVGYIVKQARQLGINAKIVGVEWTADDAKIAGADAQGTIVALDTFDPSLSPAAQKFADAYKAKYNEPAEFYAANYYDLVYVVKTLVEQAAKDGKDPTQPASLTGAFPQVKSFPTVYGAELKFQRDGSAVKPSAIYAVQTDGSLKKLTSAGGQ